MRQTVPPPVLPSKKKKLAMGGSRPPSALRMSCASIPPTIAHTGENSWPAVVDIDLEVPCNWIVEAKFPGYTYSIRERGTLLRTCLLTSPDSSKELAVASNSSACVMSSGSCL